MIYKNILLQLTVALCLFNLSACQENSIDSQPEMAPKVETDAKESYIVSPTSTSIEFNINSNTPWDIKSDQTWCTVTPTESSTSSLVTSISVMLEKNNEWKNRKANLTISGKGIEEKQTIEIVQAGRDEFVVEAFEEEIPSKGGKATFKIIANKVWKIETEDTFLSIDKVSGNGNENGEAETFTVTFTPNNGFARDGKITIKTDTYLQEFTVHQDGHFLDLENPNENKINLDGWATEKIIKLNTDIDWQVSIAPEYKEWITATQINNNEVSLMLKNNKLFIPRKGIVTLTTKEPMEGSKDIDIELTQNILYMFPNGALPDENGNIKITSANQGGTTIQAIYNYKKCHLTFEFEEVNLSDGSQLLFNMDGDRIDGYASFYNYKMTCNGSFTTRNIVRPDGTWEGNEQAVTFREEELKAVKKVEIFIEDDPADNAKLRYRLLINGLEKVSIGGGVNPFTLVPDKFPNGYGMYIQYPEAAEGDYLIVKSIDYEPYE